MIVPMLALVIAVLVAMTAVMTVGWFVQRAANNAGWVDVFWTYGTGATCALAALVPLAGATLPSLRQLMVAGLVLVWSLRLGTYVAVRVAKGPEDARYAGFRRDWGARFQSRMFGVMLIQAPATAALSISILFAARNPAPALGLTDLVGPALMFAILRFGTGVPPLEAAMLDSRGDAYRRYQARVSPFLPRPPKELSA